jgi:poly-gamma-glutamate capsule biosynthesis protein CapA/YwtB (metallophosphatase superfamily)
MKQGIIAVIFIAIITTILIMANYIGINNSIDVKLTVVDWFGQKIINTVAESSKMQFQGDINAEIKVSLKGTGPDVLMISAPGYLTETVPIGFEDDNSQIMIRLRSDSDGKRVVLNFGGDVIFGRRYLDQPLKPGLTEAEMSQARTLGVVESIYKSFANADISYINFESVIGTFNENEAYKSKLHLLQSPLDSVKALKQLGVDVVSLANNHIRDWGDQGVDSTIQALKVADIKTIGAGNAESASQPVTINKNGIDIGNLAYTTVTGSYINDFLPKNSDVQPVPIAQQDNWKWEKRIWGWTSGEWSVPSDGYRIGEVWAIYSEAKPKLTTIMQSNVWSSIVSIYPELLSFVAENGQMGAASWDSKGSLLEIQELRAKVDILVVQIHGGYQYKSAPSSSLVNAAHAAIDAGADIVISHNPHVLQGMEWYKGHLIVYSLGNLVFDQDFLDTFQTGFLRTVWESDKLIEARFIPVEIVDYYPAIVTDKSARQIIAQTWEKSLLNTQSVMKGDIVYQIAKPISEFSKPVQFKYEWGTARLSEEISTQNKTLSIKPGEIILLDQGSLWPGKLGLTNGAISNEIMIGRDLFRWGNFEDTLANGILFGGIHMKLGMPLVQWKIDLNEEIRESYIQLSRKKSDSKITLIRTIARIPIVENRIFDDALVPQDPEPQYSVRLKVRGSGQPSARLRIDSYWFYDSNPIEEPISELIDQKRYDLKIDGFGWQTLEIPYVPVLVDDKLANSIMVYIEMDPPKNGNSSIDIDELEVIEWRDANRMPEIYGAFTHIKNNGISPIKLNINILSSETDNLL